MGFERRKTYVLEFPEDSEWHGLIIRARSASAGAALSVAQGGVRESGIAAVERMFRALGGCPAGCENEHDELPPGQEHYLNRLISWNLEEDGEPVPADYAGLMAADLDLAKAVAEAWLSAILGTADPLEPSLTGGGPPAGASIPMEPLSAGPQP